MLLKGLPFIVCLGQRASCNCGCTSSACFSLVPASTAHSCEFLHRRLNLLLAGAMVEADKHCPRKNYYLSYLVMELLGPRVGCMSLETRAYKHDKPLLVNHGLCMLAVRAAALVQC
jgi:hypothetical protein